MTVSLRKEKPNHRQHRSVIRRVVKLVGFLALTYMAIDSACTRQGPAIAVAAPLIGYLALGVYMVRHRRDRTAEQA